MDLHPIFVHFPIALLILYALFELVRLRRVLDQHWWFPLKAVLVILGAASTSLAFATGENAEHLRGGETPLIEAHSAFAAAATAIFVVIAAAYLITWIARAWPDLVAKNPWTKPFVAVSAFLQRGWVAVLLALIGLLLITLVGMLGGAIAYGTTADPLAGPVLALLGLSA